MITRMHLMTVRCPVCNHPKVGMVTQHEWQNDKGEFHCGYCRFSAVALSHINDNLKMWHGVFDLEFDSVTPASVATATPTNLLLWDLNGTKVARGKG